MQLHPLLNENRLHTGVDFASPMDTPIVAASAGRVVEAGRRGFYGNYVEVEHGSGYHTTYGHLSSIGVRVGDCIDTGAVVGHSGCTGLCSGPHLHFEVLLHGAPVDPEPLLAPPGAK